MAKIVMVTGVQRSGTGALFYALAEDLGVRVFQESNASEFYLGWNLRSETELRPLLTASAQTVLTKPVNETSRRSVAELLREFTAHETWIVWIYRDPVNVFASTLEWYSVPRNANDRFYNSLCGLKDPQAALVDFLAMWNKRNRSFLALSSEERTRTALVRYEDLLDDANVFHDLCRLTGIDGRYEHKFLPDSRNGHRRLPRNIKNKIRSGTREVTRELDAARTFRADLPILKRLRKAALQLNGRK